MSQFWTLSSYFMLGRCNLSTKLFTLAQLSPIGQIQRTNLETIIGSIAAIWVCLQAGQANLPLATTNSRPITHQQNIFSAKVGLPGSLLVIVKRGLPAITSGKLLHLCRYQMCCQVSLFCFGIFQEEVPELIAEL